MATTPTPPPTTPAAPNAIDLATVADVKGYLGIAPTATGDDATIQRLITGASQHWLNRTSRPSLNTVDHYLDHYHGNGQNELMTRQYPVRMCSSCRSMERPSRKAPIIRLPAGS